MNYKSLFNNLPYPAIIVKNDAPQFLVTDTNTSFSKTFSLPGHKLLGKPFFEAAFLDNNYADEKNAQLLIDALKKASRDKKKSFFKGIQSDDDHPTDHSMGILRFDLTIVPLLKENQDVEHILLIAEDNRNHHPADTNIKYEKRFRALAEHGNDGTWILNPENKITYISPSISNVVGYTREEVLGMHISDVVHPEDREQVLAKITESFQKPGKKAEITPVRIKHKIKGLRWFNGTISNMLNNPAIGGIIINFKDITDEIEAKQRLQSFIDSINGIFFEATLDGVHFNYVSPQVEEILGYKPKKWLESKNFWAEKIHPDDRNRAVTYCREQTKLGKDHCFEYRFQKADGSYIWLRDLISVITEDGKPKVLQGLMLDITEQKKLEDQLELVYKSAKIGDWEFDFINDKVTWSRFVKELYDVPLSYVPSMESAIQFHEEGDNRDKFTKIIEQVRKSGGNFTEEFKILSAKGNVKWIRMVGQSEIQNGVCTKIFGSTQDVTERKLAELSRNEAEQNFRNVVEHSTNMFYTHNSNGDLTYMSPQSRDFLGVIPEESEKRWAEFVTDHPINEIGHQLTEKALRTGKPQPPYELQLEREDGKIIWVEVNEAPLSHDGSVTALVGSLTDITERKNFEEKLKESLETFKLVTQATRDAIYDWDLTNNHIEWGESFTTMFGYETDKKKYPIEEWESCIHHEERSHILSELKSTLYQSTDQRWSAEYRFKKRNGSYAHVVEDGYILRDDHGNPYRMVGAVRDISEIKDHEKYLKESLKEKETLLSEIHHRVKNNLAVISGLMEMQAINTDNEELTQKLIESVLRVKSIAEIHERLYQSDSFAHIQFSEGIKSLIEHIVRTLQAGTKIDLKFNMDQTELNINQSVPCSLLVNEVITNILKHGFNGVDKGTITVNLNEADSAILLEIIDDGNGLPDDFNTKVYTSMGLKLIELLSEQLEADIRHETVNGLTTFALSFKKTTKKSSENSYSSNI